MSSALSRMENENKKNTQSDGMSRVPGDPWRKPEASFYDGKFGGEGLAIKSWQVHFKTQGGVCPSPLQFAQNGSVSHSLEFQRKP